MEKAKKGLRLETIERFLEDTRGALLGALEALEPALAPRRADAGSWSAADIVEHLGQVERFINVAFMKMRREGREAPAAAIEEAPVSALLLGLGYGDIMGIPAFPKSEPGSGIPLEDGLELLRRSREKTREAFLEGRTRDYRKLSSDHPYLGSLNYYEWFYFLARHEEAHTKQLLTNVAKLKR